MHLGLIPVNKLSNLFKSFSNLSLYVGYDNKCLCISLRILGNFIQLIDTIWKTWNFNGLHDTCAEVVQTIPTSQKAFNMV